jgi:hypothetical protein
MDHKKQQGIVQRPWFDTTITLAMPKRPKMGVWWGLWHGDGFGSVSSGA